MHTLYILFPFHPSVKGQSDIILMINVQIQLYGLNKKGGVVLCLSFVRCLPAEWYYVPQRRVAVAFLKGPV